MIYFEEIEDRDMLAPAIGCSYIVIGCFMFLVLGVICLLSLLNVR